MGVCQHRGRKMGGFLLPRRKLLWCPIKSVLVHFRNLPATGWGLIRHGNMIDPVDTPPIAHKIRQCLHWCVRAGGTKYGCCAEMTLQLGGWHGLRFDIQGVILGSCTIWRTCHPLAADTATTIRKETGVVKKIGPGSLDLHCQPFCPCVVFCDTP